MLYYENRLEFNGYFHSLKHICNVNGVESFSLENDCSAERVRKLLKSNIHGSNYILPLLWCDDFEDKFHELLEKNKQSPHRIQKYEENCKILTQQLKEARKSFCGMGTSRVKGILNYISTYDNLAKILRLALEIEDYSITARQVPVKYRNYKYFHKKAMILELIDLCKEENINYGFKDSDIPTMKSIVFFDFSENKQISWHTTLDKLENEEYIGEWDGQECSNLRKIEECIVENYSSELEKYRSNR